MINHARVNGFVFPRVIIMLQSIGAIKQRGAQQHEIIFIHQHIFTICLELKNGFECKVPKYTQQDSFHS